MLKISLLFKKNANFSGYYFYIKLNILGDFQICISVPLIVNPQIKSAILHNHDEWQQLILI